MTNLPNCVKMTKREKEFIKRIEERISVLYEREKNPTLADLQEIIKERHALEWAVDFIEDSLKT